LTERWADRHFEGHDFTDEDLTRLDTERAVFDGCDFGGANMAESRHRGSAFRNCTFRRTSLWHSAFEQCSMLGSVFVQCRMRPIFFDEVDFTLAVLGGNDLRGAVVDPSLWRTASLAGARVDVGQAVAFAVAQGLRLDG
jgi:uncharacterized protein YjbI with pentapeptide repeats